jgi:hypothetical protein
MGQSMARGLVFSLLFVAACSADSAPIPALDARMPGAFVAFENQSGRYDLMRTVGGAPLNDGDRLMTFILYDEDPATVDEARDLAQEPVLPERIHQYFDWQSRVLTRPHEVVWFRTLTADEIRP